MDLRRLRVGEWLAAAGGAALVGSLFLNWYGDGVSGWEAFSALDLIFVAVGVFALALALVTAAQATVAVPIAMGSFLTLAGIAATLLALGRVVVLPGAASGRSAGVFIGLGAACALTLGALLAIRDERLSRPGRPTDATGRAARPPELPEPLPPPHQRGAPGARP